MPDAIHSLIDIYVSNIKSIYGSNLKQVILYGSYARGDFTNDSDIDIMILLNLSELEIKEYRHRLSDMTYDFNMDHDLDIKPIAKSQDHFMKWIQSYPFYSNINNEGVCLYAA